MAVNITNAYEHIPRTALTAGTLSAVGRPLPGWAGGAIGHTQHCAVTRADGVCLAEPPDAKPVGLSQAGLVFEPFDLSAVAGCDLVASMQQMGRSGEQARNALETSTAWAISRELETGAVQGNASLNSEANDISSSGAVELGAGIASLLREWAIDWGHQPTLHMPWWALPLADEANLTSFSGTQITVASGTVPVCVGPGYRGTVGPGDVQAANGEAWLYLTGPVEWGATDITVPSEGGQERRTNDGDVTVQRYGIYRFDPCQAYAVLVDVGPVLSTGS